MKILIRKWPLAFFNGLFLLLCFTPGAAAVTPYTVVDFTASGSYSLTPSSTQVSSVLQTGIGTDVTIASGTEAYPALTIKPVGSTTWNLAGTSYVELVCKNSGTTTLYAFLRADNAGSTSNSDTQSMYLSPGTTGTTRIYYGYSSGIEGYQVDPSKIVQFYLYTPKDTVNTRSVRLLKISTGGTAGEITPYTRTRPAAGRIFGNGTAFDFTTQVSGTGKNATLLASGNLKMNCGSGSQNIKIIPSVGMWDLGLFSQVRVTFKNTGSVSLTPKVRVDSGTGNTDVVSPAHALAPGETEDIVTRFTPATPWRGVQDATQNTVIAATSWGSQAGTGTAFGSHKTSGVTIVPDTSSAAAGGVLEIVSIQAENAYATPPSWLGHRPPVSGTWVKTFDDNFDDSSIVLTRWNTTTTNYWDPLVHFSANNLIMGGGYLKIHLEKKTGRQDDLPTGTLTNYATGWADSYSKWKQRYGYFEMRTKLPDVPCMWPGFWLMPERGSLTLPQTTRTSTSNGGMEFDIIEGQSIWGPYRSNFAMHWDGYTTNHQQIGNGYVYHEPDINGFITVGLLWTPGSAILYSNGVEVARWESPRICIQPCYMLLQLITGGWEKQPLDDSKLPADHTIEYVRVWQRQDLASSNDSPTMLCASSQISPTITTSPTNNTVIAGNTATFTVAATGNPAPTVQWQVSTTGTGGTFTDINSLINPSAITNTLNLSNVTTAQNGYAYQAVFTNIEGTSTTSAVILTVQSPAPVPTGPTLTGKQGWRNSSEGHK